MRHALVLTFLLLNAARGAETLPAFSAVESQLQEYFAGVKDHRRSDLISREQAKTLLDRIAAAGWQIEDRDDILADVLGERDPLVKRLRTKAGKKFMRQSAGFPLAYDRMDHLERLSDGQRILNRLVDGPDGYKMIEYLTSAPGGKNMGKMLAEAPHGVDFNKPTGRIYTQEQLLERLKESHAKAQQAAGKSSPRSNGR